jgi:hypothetical protein
MFFAAVFIGLGAARAFAAPVEISSAPAAAVAESTAAVAAPSQAPVGSVPPAPPAHARRELNTAAELALDLAEVTAYLEEGQAYFKAYQKGTHSAEENTLFLKFLQEYEREREIGRKEADTLKRWSDEKSDLE